MVEAYLATLVGVMLAQCSPGPNMMAIASAGLGQGRKAALMTVLGVASGMIIWATAVAFGLAAVVALFPSLMTAMKILGGGYLLYLAFKALHTAWEGQEATIKPNRQALSPWQMGNAFFRPISGQALR